MERQAERLNVSAPTASFHLKKLTEAGAVSSYKSQYYTMYSLNRALFDITLLSVLQEKSEEADLQQQRDAKYRQKVIDAFFEYGKLKSIPAQQKKRRIVLEVIAEQFERGKIYPEREVNLIIADFHEDFCTIRRDMIGEHLMERDARGYWRI